MEPSKKLHPMWVVIILLLILLARDYLQDVQRTQEISYSEFQSLLKANAVDHLNITDKVIRGKFKIPPSKIKTDFLTVRVDPNLAANLSQTKINFSQTLESSWFKEIVSWFLPFILFFAFWMYTARRLAQKGGLGGGLLSVGKSRAKLYVEHEVKTTFSDVAGVDEAKAELQEVVEFLKKPEEYSRLGAHMPRGILLVGPPGTGKTLLAKAVAGEARVPFFSISGSEFVELFVGVGAARVRDLFHEARTKAPCIVFIDELDSLGRARGTSLLGGHDEKEQTLNQLLAELDGFDTSLGVILLAATNRPEILDPALLRAGRFDRQVLIDRPDKKGREDILLVHLKKIKFDPKISIENIAALTVGFTGADLANLVNEAALFATRRKSIEVNDDDFTQAIERIVAGLEKKNRLYNPREKKMIAFHEMGHALVACALAGNDKVHKISIIARGIGSLGYTIQRPSEERFLMTRQELKNKMAIMLAGRVAEELIFEDLSTGAADDLVKATNLAEAIVTKYGMSTNLGAVVYDRRPSGFLPQIINENSPRGYSERTAELIDAEIKLLTDEAMNTARELLDCNHLILKRGAAWLLEKETLNESDIHELMTTLQGTPPALSITPTPVNLSH